MPKGREQRRWERYNVTIDVNITAVVNGQQSTFGGQVCDVSKGGLRLFVTREIEPGSSLTLEFLLPYHSNELMVRGVVRNRAGFTHGVEFISPTIHQQQMIERTCDVFALLR
jgi:PilZ domain